MTDFLTHRKSISKSQHGYVEGRSCQTAIIDLTSKVHENLAMNREVVLLVLDLSKAFNCVDVDMRKVRMEKQLRALNRCAHFDPVCISLFPHLSRW